MASQLPPAKRPKSHHWSEDEKIDLVHIISERTTALFSKFNSSVTRKKREQTWADVAEKLNSHHTTRREVKEIKKQWQNLKQQLKAAVQRMRQHERQTGAGRNEFELPALLEAVRDVVGADNPMLEGIPDAVNLDELLDDAGDVPLPNNAAGHEQERENSSLTEVYIDYQAPTDAIDEAMFYSLHCTEAHEDTMGSEPSNQGSLPQHGTLSLCDDVVESVVVGAPAVATSAQPSAGAAEVRTLTPRLSRPAQQTRNLQEAIELNRRNVELEHAVLEGKKRAVDTELSAARTAAEAAAKVSLAAEGWKAVSNAAVALINKCGAVADAVLAATEARTRTEERKAELELELLQLEKDRRTLEIRKLQQGLKGTSNDITANGKEY